METAKALTQGKSLWGVERRGERPGSRGTGWGWGSGAQESEVCHGFCLGLGLVSLSLAAQSPENRHVDIVGGGAMDGGGRGEERGL